MIDKNRRVSVYFNLHKKIWSVRQSGSPVEHHTEVCLRDVRYLVQPAGRAKVLKERRKNVHAFLTGYLVDRVPVPAMSFDVIYNPYKYSTFVSADDRDPAAKAGSTSRQYLLTSILIVIYLKFLLENADIDVILKY
jgi:hypothetical protein